ncbi:hypothetical protein ACFFX1_01440 [Dactylosporangium sucinum]|uniref:Uncharacterized protein n=1 Tax=Dactylosporangium sucinum TaxID=1424081 RepID=A0A917T350_9ACTN|nr:hypothetical protein [Dactylosporangium sucinum]GGM09195.1 hypothetical protein GCM10007977_007910 [Dactylosporangium sucinum]
MRRHISVLLVLLAAAATSATAGCGGSSGTTEATMAAPTRAASPSASASPEAQFLAATAAHLCSVQSRVYTDPAAMASAYAAQPRYQGLSDAQIGEFQQRTISDPAFAERLTRQVQQTCGTPR